MQTTLELLDAVKARHNLPSDYKLGIVLGLSHNAVGHYRKGRTKMDDFVCLKVADLLELDPGYVLACVHAERATDDAIRTQWARIADRLKAAASVAACALLSLAFSGSPDAHAQGREPVASKAPANFLASTVYTLQKVCERIKSTLAPLFEALAPLPTLQD